MWQLSKQKFESQVICFLIILWVLVGCGPKHSLSGRYEILPDKPDGFSLTKNVILVADNQLNYLYGDPIWLRTGMTDKLVRVAIRPVQQDLYGQDVLRWVLELYGSRLPIIHLGDATNMACRGEFESFLKIMSSAQKPWVMAPGNHDAYLFGNTQFNLGEWKAACRGADGPMTKDRLVRRYLVYLQENYENFGHDYPEEFPLKGQWRDSSDSVEFLRSVAWTIDEEKPWRSFMTQEVDLGLPGSSPPISAILLDTSQYDSAPTLVPTPISPNAGVNGNLRSDQQKIILNWLKDDPTGKKMTILMGHHPYGTLLPDALKSVSSMLKKYRVPLYVSAHTHNGEYIARGGSQGNEGWLELNIGSIVDWPMEFRTLSVQEIRDQTDRLIFRTELFRVPDSWEWTKLLPPRSPVCKESWEVKLDDPDFYIAYMENASPDPQKTQDALMDSLLHTYNKLLKHVPSAEDNQNWLDCCSSDEAIQLEINNALANYGLQQKISLLKSLEQFERNRTPQNPLTRRDYRLCQAVWASKYDKLERRKPIPSDTYISFPRR